MPHSQSNLTEAIAFHERGQFSQAKAICEQIVATEPNHAEALHLLGVIAYQTNDLQAAVTLISCAIEVNPVNSVFYSNRGNALQLLNQLEAAIENYDQAIAINPNFSEAYFNRGNALQALMQFEAAVESYESAIHIRPNFAEAYGNCGNALQALNQLEEAVKKYNRAVAIKPTLSDTYLNCGLALQALGQLDKSIESYNHAIAIKPNFAEAYFNRGNALHALKELDAAIESYEYAINLQPDYVEAYMNGGNTLLELNRFEAAIKNYDCAIEIKPDCADAYLYRGNALLKLMRCESAVESYNCAIAIQPDRADIYLHRGNALLKLMQCENAVESYNNAISIQPDMAEAYVGRGAAQQELKQLEAAVVSYEKAMALNPNFEYLLGAFIHTKMSLCDWANLNENRSELVRRIENNEKVSAGFPLVPITNSPSIQRKVCEIWLNDKHPTNSSLGVISKPLRCSKIRVGYFSADFYMHSVSVLTVDLFEHHDKSRFEIFAFSFGPGIKDVMRERLENAFDQFIDVRHLADKEIALLVREMEIDIAIDLGGATQNSRPGIFSYRAAPIQVNYLGWPGTMGAEYFDYLIADNMIVPKTSQQYYTEKIVYLPNSYQSNDSKRKIIAKKLSREELGLPEAGFVFCCFNNCYKITPELFNSWMRILKAVKGSVLFLYVDNKIVEKNLKKEAQARGVDLSRLVFGERLPTEDYLARYKAADLFLNTFPYNAGTTASDALWVGLPILTRSGETFVSRVTGSVLNAIGLPELITYSFEEYETLAIELATHPTKLNEIKVKLAANRLTTPLFDTALFTQNLENAYIQMVERYQADMAPDHIYVESFKSLAQTQISLEEAISFYQKGELLQAKVFCERVLITEPKNADLLHLLGVIEFQLNNLQEAALLISRAIDINPTHPDFYSNRGNIMQALRQFEAAIEDYNCTLSIDPYYAEAYSNRGNALQQLKQFDAAIESFNSAIAIQADFAEAYSNCGNAWLALMQYEKAIENYNSAIKLKPDFAEAYLNRGNALLELMEFERSVESYTKAITLNPYFDYLPGTLLHTKMKICEWSNFDKDVSELINKIERKEKASFCFPLHSLTNSSIINRKVAELFTQYERPFDNSLGDIIKGEKPEKIRVGYFSADFNFHPVSILLAELFETHDKKRFEIIAFSFGPDIKDVMRERVEKSFDQFMDVRNLSDKDAALLAREMKIDIAIDLGGDTTHSRSSIFSYRAAPIQLTYLGWPGTMGADYFDYLIADKVILPEEYQQYYAEKIVYMPDSYQANDSKRKISDSVFTRSEIGLPSDGFVYCCFNNNYKITPIIFDSWMRILNATPTSVLLLYADNKKAEQNLRKEAQARGVNPNRLIFAGRLEQSDYLARYQVADLFLNTFPYNAGTTASDALWAGLPVLTWSGETFVSRVTASLLNAIGLPELVTTTQRNYEDLAIELAADPMKLSTIKARLIANKLTTPLFDTTLFTKHIEAAFTQMIDRYYANLAPDHIYVKPD